LFLFCISTVKFYISLQLNILWKYGGDVLVLWTLNYSPLHLFQILGKIPSCTVEGVPGGRDTSLILIGILSHYLLASLSLIHYMYI
jgi:hypothetical protein